MAVGDEETCTRINMMDKKFVRCLITPSATRFGFRHCRNFLTFNGTFTLSRYRMTFLIAASFDGNNETLPLCWGLVPTENTDHWSWFIEEFSDYIYHFTVSPGTVVLSNRDKGLAEAVQRHLPLARHGHCCQHIADM